MKARVQKQAPPRAVLRFLATEWLKLLIIAYAKGGRESRAWHSLVETMDIMVWSLSPKQTTAERQRLVSVLPGLLKRLTMGMNIVNTKQQTRERFNSVLMRCHAKAIGGGDAAHSDVESPLSAEHAATQRAQMGVAGDDLSAGVTGLGDAGGMIVEEVSIESPMVEAIELSEPESEEPMAVQIQSEMRPVAAPETLPAVTVKNPFGDGSIELEEVSFGDLPGVMAAHGAAGAVGMAGAGGAMTIAVPGEEPPLPTGDEWTELVLQFKEGDWIELHEEGAPTVQARLSYVQSVPRHLRLHQPQGNEDRRILDVRHHQRAAHRADDGDGECTAVRPCVQRPGRNAAQECGGCLRLSAGIAAGSPGHGRFKRGGHVRPRDTGLHSRVVRILPPPP